MIGINFRSGTLPNATPVVVNCSDVTPPALVALNSADVARKIELSVDGGVNYFTPIYDQNSAAQIVVAINNPISHIRLTGAAAGTDTYQVR